MTDPSPPTASNDLAAAKSQIAELIAQLASARQSAGIEICNIVIDTMTKLKQQLQEGSQT